NRSRLHPRHTRFLLARRDRRRGREGNAANLQLRHRHDRRGCRRECPGCYRRSVRRGRDRGAARPDGVAFGRWAWCHLPGHACPMTSVESHSRKRVVVFISGGGSNMLTLAKACAAPEWPAEITCVISDKASAGGLAKAEA